MRTFAGQPYKGSGKKTINHLIYLQLFYNFFIIFYLRFEFGIIFLEFFLMFEFFRELQFDPLSLTYLSNS